MPCRRALIVSALLAAVPAAAQSGSADGTPDGAAHRSVQAYAGLGITAAAEPLRAAAGGVAFRAGADIWTVRGALNPLANDLGLWDVGFLYGRVLGSDGRGWLAAGVAVVGGTFEECTGGLLSGSCSDTAVWPTLGLPIELHLALFHRRALGVDLVAFTNINERRSFAGLVAALRLGSAAPESEAAVRPSAAQGSQVASPRDLNSPTEGARAPAAPAVLAAAPGGANAPADLPFRPGAPLRVTYCADGCAPPRLTATGRFAGLRVDSLRMHPDVRLRARVRRDGLARDYAVVQLADAAVWIDAGEPVWVPLEAGWRAGSDGLSIPFQGATRVEYRVPRPAGAGAVHGAVVGGAIGAVGLGLAALIDQGDPALALIGAGFGALIGAPPGALIGAAAPGTQWENVTDHLPELEERP